MARNNNYKEQDYHSVQKLVFCVSLKVKVFLCNLEHCIIFPELNTISYVIYFLFSDRIS